MFKDIKFDPKTTKAAIAAGVAAVVLYLSQHNSCWQDLVPPGTENLVGWLFAAILALLPALAKKEPAAAPPTDQPPANS